ncbi:MAG TPA: rhomboid family intramembrane serine protease [Gemmatimonadaceae bacterium]|nr:rhomboid family intramembrane serine protease [Gemmatimonadaceae bacterium]
MFPLSDDNPTVRTPVATYLIIAAIVGVWVFVQGAGLNTEALASSICNLGMVPGEITGQAPLGQSVPIGPNMACVVDDYAINIWTPLTSMFLHGGWGHLIGNLLFFWVFGNNVEDSMGRVRFVVFYLLCGLIAAAAHVVLDPRSPVPTVGASGAISGILGAYLILYPKVRVRMLFWFILFIRIIPIPAWAVLLWWFFWQVVAGLPQLMTVDREVSGGVAVWAHIGGFVAGVVLVKLFVNQDLHRRRLAMSDARDVFQSA